MTRRQKRAQKRLEIAMNGYENACSIDPQGSKAYTKPGKMKPH